MSDKHCKICNTNKPIGEFFKCSPRRGAGLRDRCKLCCKAYNKKWKLENKDSVKQYNHKKHRTPQGQFQTLRGGAKKRGIVVEITFEQFISLRKGRCTYCQGPLPECGAGLDRINNSIGYVLSNLTPCCGDCNMLKNSTLSHHETLEVVKLLKTLRCQNVA